MTKQCGMPFYQSSVRMNLGQLNKFSTPSFTTKRITGTFAKGSATKPVAQAQVTRMPKPLATRFGRRSGRCGEKQPRRLSDLTSSERQRTAGLTRKRLRNGKRVSLSGRGELTKSRIAGARRIHLSSLSFNRRGIDWRPLGLALR